MIRTALLPLLLCLTALLPAQDRTGRHYLRNSRLPTTAATAPVAEASTTKSTARVQPLRKLRSGRSWPQYHFTRLPQTPAAGTTAAAEASTPATTPAPKRGFWRARR